MAATTQPKPQNDAYTGILFISLLALIGACVLLYMDYDQYGARTPQKAPTLEPPTKSIDKGTISPTIPAPAPNPVEKNEPKAKGGDPMGMKPLKRDTEVAVSKPRIQAPPTVPASIPALDVPGVPPAPVVAGDETKVIPAKFETLSPLPGKPILDLTPVEPMKDMEPTKPALAPLPTLDGPPVSRPFVPEK